MRKTYSPELKAKVVREVLKEENYRSWNITPKGLQITFDDYQVTPHAAGPQQVLVPYATLKALIDPAGPLAEFIK